MIDLRASAKGSRAEIYIYDDIGGDMFGDGIRAKDVAQAMKTLGNASELDIFINSYGGSVFEGLAIFNLLRRHPAKITSHVDGIAASVASVIAMAGDRVNIASNGFLMIHDAWGIAMGNGEAMRRAATDIDLATNSIAETYASRRKIEIDRLRGWMAEETWFNASQAVEVGLADAMTDENRIAAFVPPDRRFPFRHTPDFLWNTAPEHQTHVKIERPKLDRRVAALADLSGRLKAIQRLGASGIGRATATTTRG